jgi:hypothetical protein
MPTEARPGHVEGESGQGLPLGMCVHVETVAGNRPWATMEAHPVNDRNVAAMAEVDAIVPNLTGAAKRHLELGASSSARGVALEGSDLFTHARQVIDQMELEYHAHEARLNACEAAPEEAWRPFRGPFPRHPSGTSARMRSWR